MNNTGASVGFKHKIQDWASDFILMTLIAGGIYSFLVYMFFFSNTYEPAPESGVYHETATMARTLGIRWVPGPTAMWVGLAVALGLGVVLAFVARANRLRRTPPSRHPGYIADYRSRGN